MGGGETAGDRLFSHLTFRVFCHVLFSFFRDSKLHLVSCFIPSEAHLHQTTVPEFPNLIRCLCGLGFLSW